MHKVVLWIGPVWPGIIKGAVPADWSILTFDDHKVGGNGSNAYKNWALSLGPDPLSRVAPNAQQIVVAGFSRAHGAIEVFSWTSRRQWR
jgi:predicted esterase